MTHFQDWYPEWGFIFNRIIQDNCSTEYSFMLQGPTTRQIWQDSLRWTGAGTSTAHAVPLVNCIIEHSSEYIKSGMAAAGVMLGLAPTILATLGSGVDETSVLSVIGRKPLLALCLSAGSPAVVPLRLFQHRRPTEVIDVRASRLEPLSFSNRWQVVILMLEYLAVLAAIVNIGTLGYEFGIKVVVFVPHLTWLALVWVFGAVIPHTFGALSLWFRVRFEKDDDLGTEQRIINWMMPSSDRHVVHVGPETLFCAFLSGFTSILIGSHLVFGSLLFSSALFISPRDALPVILRFLGSVILCRIVLMYELAKLRGLFHGIGGSRLLEHDSFQHCGRSDTEGLWRQDSIQSYSSTATAKEEKL